MHKWKGKQIAALRKDGTIVEGKLLKISGNKLKLFIQPKSKGPVRTKAILPLVLFDTLAVAESPYGFGRPYGYGYPGYGYPGYYGGFGW
ncbi:hypothetical protein [Marinicrinis sediminis]|uniref:50S ribosomal protein L33 n=1 Tax=Marinicrinis sediminis TaxID=1652465 RepID=A0ABW5RD63_9BACL